MRPMALTFGIAGVFLIATPPGLSYTVVAELTHLEGARWQYTYRVSGTDFPAGAAIEVLFNESILDITVSGETPAGWDAQTIEPEPLFEDPGRFSALTAAGSPAPAGPFTVRFLWLGLPGAAPPEPQLFEIIQFDAGGAFVRTIETGTTVLAAREFIRGDCNGDREVDISDAVKVLAYLFLSEPKPLCLEACNSNGDGQNDISDPVYLLAHLFLGGSAPPPPHPVCGPGPQESTLGCDDPRPCSGEVGR